MHRSALILLIFLTGITCHPARCQNPVIDSLKTILNNASADSTRLRLHFMIAQRYLVAGTHDSQLAYASKALESAGKIQPLNEQQQKFYAGAVRLKGIYYRTQGDYDRAIGFYLQALHEFEALKDSNGQASTINSIGIAYLALKRYDEAYEYFSKAYGIDRALRKREKEVADLTNMCYALHGKGDRPDSFYTKALTLAHSALDIADTLQDKQLQVSCLEAIAISLMNLLRYNESMVYQQKALSLAEELGQKALIAEQQYLVAQLYIFKEEYEKAIEYGLKSEKIADEESFVSLYHDIYQGLSTSYEKSGNYKKAFEYAWKLNKLIDTTYQAQIADQLKIFESERKDNQINLLSSQNDLKEKENLLLKAKNERNQILLGTAVISILLLIALLYAVYRNRQAQLRHVKELESLNAALSQQKDEITRMNMILELKALRAQMNPHFIFNCMSSIQECMLTGQLDEANIYLTKLSKLLRMVLEYSDEESISLDKELEILGLYLELESVRLKEGFQYTIHIDDEIFAEEILVPTLILQPFAENAIWHGLLNKPADRKLKVSISMKDSTLLCSIEDNGVGREKAIQLKSVKRKHHSRGLKLIEKRLEILRQKTHRDDTGFTFQDLYGYHHEPTGTRVEITLPVMDSAA